MKRLVYTIVLLLFVVITQAQNDTVKVAQEATGLRADNKIWVVMAVCVTILIGLILYVVSIDRKVTKLEKK